MPDKTTIELLDDIEATPLTSEAVTALNDLKDRIIKEGDADDIVQGGVETTRGGIRPKKQPLVP